MKKHMVIVTTCLLIICQVMLAVLTSCGTFTAGEQDIMAEGAVKESQISDTVQGTEKGEEAGELDEAGEALVEETEKDTEAGSVQVMDISPEEVFKIIENNEDYLIIDVRTKEEYDTGYIDGAILLPVQELEERLGELPMDKPIIIYCRSGSRSRRAAETLIANGFTMVYDMGGISSWTDKGYQIIIGE